MGSPLTKFARRNALHLMFFGFVLGVRWALPGTSVMGAITAFLKNYAFDRKDFNEESLRKVFNEMSNELIAMQRENA